MTDRAQNAYRIQRQNHWSRISKEMVDGKYKGRYYHRRLTEIYRHLVSPGERVIELGCGPGRLLAGIKPSHGLGIDFCEDMVTLATAKRPPLRGRRWQRCPRVSKNSKEQGPEPGNSNRSAPSDSTNI